MKGVVAINQEYCLNFNYPQMSCSSCVKSCSQVCIDPCLTVNDMLCNECGLCLAVCPAEAVTGENFSRQSIEQILVADVSPLVLDCQHNNRHSAWPCLGFLNGRLLLSLVLSGKDGDRQVVVDNSKCASCRPLVADWLKKLAAEITQILVKIGKQPVISGDLATDIKQPEKIVSRRAFFAQIMGAAVNAVRDGAGSSGGELLPRRQWFTEYAASLSAVNDTVSRLFYNLRISLACRTCGRCYRLCPNKAIVTADQGTALEFFHNPLLCSGCGVCARHCPNGAISLTEASKLSIYPVVLREFPRCDSCGQVYQPVSNQPVCLECFLKCSDK
ncbi:MAG: 4Fe-4S binding protein [Firmicutes bacterium]|nr:4Fe-4S binding protein [Bacillota bacterium]